MKFSETHRKNLSLSHKGQHSSPTTEFKKGLTPWNFNKNVIKKCLVCFKAFRVPNCRKYKAKFCTKRCKGKFYVGEKSCHYKKDRSLVKHQEERNNPEYKQWRYQVYKRDRYVCRIGNTECIGKLEAHHILSWRDYPELRYNINNGITLCRTHHPKKRVDEIKLIQTFTGLVMQTN